MKFVRDNTCDNVMMNSTGSKHTALKGQGHLRSSL